MTSIIQNPVATFLDTDGSPLSGGSIYFGLVGQNPETAPIPVYWDYAATQPAAQPIKTINGQPARAGTPAILFVSAVSYSMTVKNKTGKLVQSLSDTTSVPTMSSPSGSSLVGHLATGTGAIATTVQAKLSRTIDSRDYTTEANAQAAATALLTGGFWSDQAPAPQIFREPGRLMVGNAVKTSGASSQTANESWVYSSFGAYWLERGAQLMSATEGVGYIGSFSAARTSTVGASNNIAIGVAGIAWNDHTATQRYAWAGYFEVSRELGAEWSYGLEIVGKNKGDNHLRNPYAKDSSGVIGAFFAGGGDNSYNGSSLNPNNAAIVIGKNSNTWNTGICFDSDALTGSDGLTGTAAAIKMGLGHRLDWYCDASNLGAQIHSQVTAGAGKNKTLIFSDSNIFLGLGTSGSLFNFSMPVSSVNGIQFSSTVAGVGNVVISAAGSDTNIDLSLSTQGTGLVRFGFYSASGLAQTGYITIKDSGGTVRRLLVG